MEILSFEKRDLPFFGENDYQLFGIVCQILSFP